MFMNIFLILTFLFAIGGMTGWVIEVFYRRFVSQKHWVNPGFLTGPCLPLYGESLCILYLLAHLEGYLYIEPVWLEKLLLFIIMSAAITALECVVGVIMLATTHVRLWDYSELPGNIRGIICPLFTFFWGLLSAVYYFLVHPHILEALEWLSQNLAFFIWNRLLLRYICHRSCILNKDNNEDTQFCRGETSRCQIGGAP